MLAIKIFFFAQKNRKRKDFFFLINIGNFHPLFLYFKSEKLITFNKNITVYQIYKSGNTHFIIPLEYTLENDRELYISQAGQDLPKPLNVGPFKSRCIHTYLQTISPKSSNWLQQTWRSPSRQNVKLELGGEYPRQRELPLSWLLKSI